VLFPVAVVGEALRAEDGPGPAPGQRRPLAPSPERRFDRRGIVKLVGEPAAPLIAEHPALAGSPGFAL
jgi:hypothetical protein